jgi:hypothetical protein
MKVLGPILKYHPRISVEGLKKTTENLNLKCEALDLKLCQYAVAVHY